jgi:uncharacterized damage-inducible protein DinB
MGSRAFATLRSVTYGFVAIADHEIPEAADAVFQHVVETYVSETNKVISTWKSFEDGDLAWRPDEKSSTVLDILRHQLLSERRFFGEFLGSGEPPAELVLPSDQTVDAYAVRMRQLAVRRLPFLAARTEEWWLEGAPFFGEQRQRIWIFWRRVLHTCHHRTQLTVYLRLLGKPVLSTYGPTADVTWSGADPTNTVEAARRR